jgi:hypothetical protein
MSFYANAGGKALCSDGGVNQFDRCFDIFGLGLEAGAGLRERSVTLIARSPSSPAALALVANLRRFRKGFLHTGVILGQIGPVQDLQKLAEVLNERIEGPSPAFTMIKWARNRALLDAHERLTLGTRICWTGDVLRREDSRNGLDRIEDATPELIAQAHTSFEALWKASRPLPETAFCRLRPHIPVASVNRLPGGAQGQEHGFNVLQLEDYLRLRKH